MSSGIIPFRFGVPDGFGDAFFFGWCVEDFAGDADKKMCDKKWGNRVGRVVSRHGAAEQASGMS